MKATLSPVVPTDMAIGISKLGAVTVEQSGGGVDFGAKLEGLTLGGASALEIKPSGEGDELFGMFRVEVRTGERITLAPISSDTRDLAFIKSKAGEDTYHYLATDGETWISTSGGRVPEGVLRIRLA